MLYFIPRYTEHTDPWCFTSGIFDDTELDSLQAQAKNATQRAIVNNTTDKQELDKIRRSQVSWIERTQESEWIFVKLAHAVATLNAQFFRFDLTSFGEALQLTNYDQSENGMYGWHQDSGGKNQVNRKLSIVVQLTDPAEYEGGNLQIMTSANPQNIRKQRGLIAAFPSYQLHQVTPVTQGSRQSLVAWVSGPPFR